MKKLTDKQKAYNLKRSERAMEYLSKSKKTRTHRNRHKSTYNSRFINLLQGVITGEHEVKKVNAEITVPSNFSLIENPHESLITICKLANTVRGGKKIKNFHINHSSMTNMDLAAECILDLVVTEIRREHRSRYKKPIFTGQYPSLAHLQRLLRGIGIIKSLQVEHEYLPRYQESKIEVFARSSKNIHPGATPGSMGDIELAAKNFVDYVNRCLKRTDRELTVNAVDHLSTYTGEVIGNADEHSGESSWFVMGYYDHHDESHLCEIAIFNFGKTFADTFMSLPENSFAYKTILPYIDKHKKRGFTHSWKKEDLLTLVALQGDISCKNTNQDDTRGNGTVEMIEFFDKISQECSNGGSTPEMAIISGNTHIRFDGKYTLTDDKSGRKIIAFNSENDLNYPPDSAYVTNFGPLLSFPGTVISIKFRLPENQVSEI